MKLWEALKIHDETGRMIRCENGCFLNPGTVDDSLALCMMENWEVEPAKVQVTREQVNRAVNNAIDAMDKSQEQILRRTFVSLHICKELGL